MVKAIFILTLILIALCCIKTNDYGYFNVGVNNVKTCQGPKRKNCCVNSIHIKNGTAVTFDMLVKEDAMPLKGKIYGSLQNKQMVRLPMNRPCDHFYIKPIMTALFNTSGCSILKGHYHFDLDYAELFVRYYSGMFLYGNWTFKALFYNDDCNVMCTVTEFNLYPKKDKKKQ